MEYLCECDPAGPFLRGGVEKSADQRDVAKRAVDRRKTVLEHLAADDLRAYFREERARVVAAVEAGRDAGEAVDSLEGDLAEVYRSVWGVAAKSWGEWAAGHAGEHVAKYRADQERDEEGRWVDEGGGGSRGAWASVRPRGFIEARSKTTRPGFLSHLEPGDLSTHRLYVNPDSTVGFALDPDGDVQNLFNNDGPQGGGTRAVFDAVRMGGRTLDCFDEYLPTLYAQAGFVETGRMKFDRDQAPDDWDYKKDGTPDVVFMAWKGWPDDDERRAEARATGDRKGWRPHTRSEQYHSDYGEAKAAARGGALRGVAGGAGGSAAHGPAGEPRRPAVPRPERHAGVAKAGEPAYDYGAPVDQWLRANAGKRIAGITETTRKRVAAEIAAGRAAGETLRQIARRIDKFYLEDIIPNRSMVIARTEVGHATNWAQDFIARDTEARGVPLEKEWLCVVGDTRVAGPEVRYAARRLYSGPLVELRTLSGRVVTVTGQHRVLTGRGWIAADAVHEGDDLVRYERDVEAGMPRSGRVPDVNDVPPMIEEVFDALYDPASRCGAVTRVVHLDGEGRDCEIEVVPVDGHLRSDLEPSSSDDVRNLLLKLSDFGLAALLYRRQSIQESCGAALADVPQTQPFHPLSLDFQRLTRDTHLASRGPGATRNPGKFQAFSDGASGAIVTASERKQREAAAVLFRYDRCVSTKTIAARGRHVFDYTTATGWMVANGLVVHNSLHDLRTRDDHLEADEQRVPLDEPFDVGDDQLMYPGDSSLGAGPEQTISCRCTTLHHVVDEPRQKAAAPISPPPSPAEFARLVLGVEDPDVVTALAFARGVFGEGDDWVAARKTLMKRVNHLRRAPAIKKYNPNHGGS